MVVQVSSSFFCGRLGNRNSYSTMSVTPLLKIPEPDQWNQVKKKGVDSPLPLHCRINIVSENELLFHIWKTSLEGHSLCPRLSRRMEAPVHRRWERRNLREMKLHGRSRHRRVPNAVVLLCNVDWHDKCHVRTIQERIMWSNICLNIISKLKCDLCYFMHTGTHIRSYSCGYHIESFLIWKR